VRVQPQGMEMNKIFGLSSALDIIALRNSNVRSYIASHNSSVHDSRVIG
jgi:hypothetical protein